MVNVYLAQVTFLVAAEEALTKPEIQADLVETEEQAEGEIDKILL
jgi:hypothetical protein